MRIHCMSLVKNECDIVAQSLTEAATWADAIYVYDNGSDDGTWEIVRELASTQRQIIPFEHDATPFSQALRRRIFEAFRDRSAHGDWWCLLDADEFYIDDPRTFLAAVPEPYDEVWSASF
jgi:glycosyltransferase involved in cell wall biosynthesis